MIALENISVSLVTAGNESKEILKDISLKIPSADWLAIVGPNGSGKTTLIKSIAGLMPLSRGTLTKSDAAGNNSMSSMLFFQEPDNQFVTSSVWNELLLNLSADELKSFNDVRPSGTKEKVTVKLEEAIGRFDLKCFLDRNPHNLSGGEKQRLVMACAYLADPDILLLDEPTSFLDAKSKEECIDFINNMNEKGKTVIWTSTGGDELLSATRGIYLEEGEIKFVGVREELIDFLAKKTSLSLPRVFQAARELVEIIKEDSSKMDNTDDEVSPYPCTPVVEATNISYAYESKERALGSVSFEVQSGELVAVTGPNGSGKTTLLEIIGGIIEPASGKLILNRDKFATGLEDNGPSCHGGIFYLIQSPERMFFAETVIAEIAFGLKAFKFSSSDIFSIASHALSLVGLELDLLKGRSPLHLSMGEMRRLAFAIAISLRPGLLLMDEPTACLDREGEMGLRALLCRAKHDNVTVVMASHDIDFVASVSDRLIFLEKGEVRDILRIENHRIKQAYVWPSVDKPYVLELQQGLHHDENGSRGLALSMDGFFRGLFYDPEAYVP